MKDEQGALVSISTVVASYCGSPPDQVIHDKTVLEVYTIDKNSYADLLPLFCLPYLAALKPHEYTLPA